MNSEIFAIHDAAADMFIDPFPAPTIEFAIRGFREACETEGHQFGKFPEDYALYHVGTFDKKLGIVQSVTARKIAMATSFVGGPGRDLDFQDGKVEIA